MHQGNHQPLEQSAYCRCSAAKSCLTLCHLMNCSMLGSSVLHYLPEFAQCHVHEVADASHNRAMVHEGDALLILYMK